MLAHWWCPHGPVQNPNGGLPPWAGVEAESSFQRMRHGDVDTSPARAQGEGPDLPSDVQRPVWPHGSQIRWKRSVALQPVPRSADAGAQKLSDDGRSHLPSGTRCTGGALFCSTYFIYIYIFFCFRATFPCRWAPRTQWVCQPFRMRKHHEPRWSEEKAGVSQGCLPHVHLPEGQRVLQQKALVATRSGQDPPVDVIRIFTRGQPETLTSGCEGRKFPRALSRPPRVNLTRPHTSKPPLDTAWGLPSTPHGAMAPRSLRGFPPGLAQCGRRRRRPHLPGRGR